jgi:Raf kinase inhibitor-like YbhB/YbcL family protein
MGLAHKAATAVGHALSNVRAGTDKLASRKLVPELLPTLSLHSVVFPPGKPLPISCTVEGAGEPPPLSWDTVPEGTVSLALICEDPDAPFPEPFVHWLVYAIPATARALTPPFPAGAREGQNSMLKGGFTPAAPPPGHGLHHYHFQLFALDTVSTFEPDVGRGMLLDNMRDHVLAWGELIGTYQRS